MLAGILGGNVVLTVIICATFAVWVWFWVPGLYAYATRSMIAWSFDRALFLSLVLYLMWNDPVAAGPLIRNPLPVEFWITVATIGFGILWYLGVKTYRLRQGIDIRLAFQQIPIE